MTSLVIQTAFLGDVVLTTPLLAALAERHGPLDVVTTPAAAPLLETLPAVRRVRRYDKRGTERGLTGFFTLAQALRAERYETAYLPHRSLRSALLACLARVPRRVGFHDGWPSLYTEVKRRPAAGSPTGPPSSGCCAKGASAGSRSSRSHRDRSGAASAGRTTPSWPHDSPLESRSS